MLFNIPSNPKYNLGNLIQHAHNNQTPRDRDQLGQAARGRHRDSDEVSSEGDFSRGNEVSPFLFQHPGRVIAGFPSVFDLLLSAER